jgi:hypothetical protein
MMIRSSTFAVGSVLALAPSLASAVECITPEVAIGRMQVFLDNSGMQGTMVQSIDPKSGHLIVLLLSPHFPQPSVSEFVDGCLYMMDGMTIEEILGEIPETRKGTQT